MVEFLYLVGLFFLCFLCSTGSLFSSVSESNAFTHDSFSFVTKKITPNNYDRFRIYYSWCILSFHSCFLWHPFILLDKDWWILVSDTFFFGLKGSFYFDCHLVHFPESHYFSYKRLFKNMSTSLLSSIFFIVFQISPSSLCTLIPSFGSSFALS